MTELSERDGLITQILSARTAPQVDAAEAALSDYLASHPGDSALLDGYEQLAMMRDAITPDDTASEFRSLTSAAPALPEQGS